MKDSDYHSLFYYHILAVLQNYRSAGGTALKPARSVNAGVTFSIMWHPRNDRYEHRYQRDKFLAERDRYVVGEKNGEYVVLMRVNRRDDKAIIYKRAMKHLFGKNIVVAKRELIGLMEKFYELTFEEKSGHRQLDAQEGEDYPSHITVDTAFRKNNN